MNWARRFPFWHEAILALLLVGLLGAAGIVSPAFLTGAVQSELSTHAWELALLALPMTLVIITAGIDLSIGAVMALSAVCLGLCFEAGMSPWLAALVAVAVGAVAGLINGWFVAVVRVHPLIVTLATMAVFQGIAEGISLGRPISGFPDHFAQLSGSVIAGLPLPGWLFLAMAGATAAVLSSSTVGRSIYAIGHAETAARFSGIHTARIKMCVYLFSGTTAGLAAALFVSRRHTASADVGRDIALDVITAVVLGGASIFGGKGRILGTALGVLLIHETRELVSWLWSRDELNYMVIGTLLITSVLLNTLLSARRR